MEPWRFQWQERKEPRFQKLGALTSLPLGQGPLGKRLPGELRLNKPLWLGRQERTEPRFLMLGAVPWGLVKGGLPKVATPHPDQGTMLANCAPPSLEFAQG